LIVFFKAIFLQTLYVLTVDQYSPRMKDKGTIHKRDSRNEPAHCQAGKIRNQTQRFLSMSHRKTICLFLLVLMIALPMTTEAARKAEDKNDENCLDRIKISRNDDPWQDMPESSWQEEAKRNIAAVEINKGTYEVFPHLAAYQLNSEMLLGKDKVKKRVVINNRYFSTLEKADATRLPAGTVKSVGKYLDTSFLLLSPKQIVRFLLDAQIITTYWHLEAELCLTGEKDGKDAYVAAFTGVHRYCTNRCQADSLGFTVTIDRNTGNISVTGN
jgi:hypothetical protein